MDNIEDGASGKDRREYYRAYQRERYKKKRQEILARQQVRYAHTRDKILQKYLEKLTPEKQQALLKKRAEDSEMYPRLKKTPQTAQNKKPRQILSAAKVRAKREGIPFNLDESDIQIPELCPVLGIKLETNPKNSWHWDNSPSLDRLVPELGYIKGNVQVISMRANRIKTDATLEELEALVAWLKERLWETQETFVNIE